ncbi:MAG: hypothetical protein ISS63_12560 [Desulfobacteraceae bacterium]|nr:hypothetical protein [Desulfobacteraceae bacterium]
MISFKKGEITKISPARVEEGGAHLRRGMAGRGVTCRSMTRWRMTCRCVTACGIRHLLFHFFYFQHFHHLLSFLILGRFTLSLHKKI